MVSPAKVRAAGFANLREIGDGRYDSNARKSRGRNEARYESKEDPRKRLRRVTAYVRQSLEPFYRAGISSLRAGVPAADTIRKFLDKTTAASVDLHDFRKCLFALGVTAEDSAFLIDSLDRQRTGVMDSKLFSATFLPARHVVGGGARRRLRGEDSGEDNNEPANLHANVAAFHQRVVERVLVKYANVKDAFRQYDTSRSGVLTLGQFRSFLRDLGFAGSDVEALIRHLDRGEQHGISFNAFAQGVRLATDQSYAKSSPKRKIVEPLKSREDEDEEADPIERIRTKLRQRVIGRNKSIREVFLEFDADGNGHLDHDEFKRFMAAYNFTPEETQLAIEFLDKDFSGTIDYDEFASGLLFYRPNANSLDQQPKTAMTEDERQAKHGAYLLRVVREKLAASSSNKDLVHLRGEFARFDADGSGALDYQEFSSFLVGLGVKLSPRDLEALMLVIDEDGSQQIEFHEFVSVFGSREPVASRRTRSSPREREPPDVLDAVFSRYDVDKSGQLDYAEFSQLMRDHGFGEGDIVRVIKQIDRSNPHGDGVDLDTFKAVAQSREWKRGQKAKGGLEKKASIAQSESLLVSRILRDHQSLEEAFRQHDLDGSGVLEHDEFRRFMKHYGMRDDAQISELIAALDGDDSGTVSLDEFMAHFQLKPTRTAKPKPGKPDKLLELKQVWVEEVLDHHESLASAFRDHDRKSRGELDYEEFRDLMSQYGISDDANVRLLLSQLDADGSGTVSLEEFVAVFGPLAKKLPGSKSKRYAAAKIKPSNALAAGQAKANAVRLRLLEEEWVKKALSVHGSVRQAFDHFDADGSGQLDHDEFRQLLAAFGITREDDVATMIKRLDVDNSGSIDYDEFATLFHENRVKNPPRRTTAASPTKMTTTESKASSAARLRELEVKWIKRVLSCHPSIEAAFAEYDRDGNGELDVEEFAHFMKRYGIIQDEDIARLVRRLDLDGSGTIDVNEFTTVFNALRCGSVGSGVRLGDDDELDPEELASVLEIERELAERILASTRDLRAAFQKFDLNGNGKLEYKEFRTVLKSYKFPEPEIRKVIRHLDKDVSGFIDYREFISAFAAVTDGAAGGKRGSIHARRVTATGKKNKKPAASPKKKEEGSVRDPMGAMIKTLLERILKTHGTVQSAFRKYDVARNGCLEPDQFERLVVDFGFSREDSMRLLREFDTDQSGTIEYEEFLTRLIREGR